MIYFYQVIYKDRRTTSLYKSATLDGIRKIAYHDLKNWIIYAGSPSCVILRTKATDVAIDKNGDYINPKTMRYVEGEYVGTAYIDHAGPLFYRGGKYVFTLLSNGKLGGIDRTLVL